MKSTIADIVQLFNVKEIAAANLTPDAIPEGQFGIVDESTGQTVSPANFASLPEKFNLINKVNGKVFYSFETIEKKYILNQRTLKYKAGQVEKYKAVIENCNCTESVKLEIYYQEENLIRRDGQNWTHKDFFVEVSPAEFKCFCDCEGKGSYENNVMTMLLYKQIKEKNSPYYDAEVHEVGGSKLADLEAIKQFIKDNKTVNTDDDKSNDKKLELHIIGKPQENKGFSHPDINYIHLQGVQLNPTITVNGESVVKFEKTQEFAYEIGNGANLRSDEYENMNHYTDLYYFRNLADGIANPEVASYFQFDNGGKYDTFTFEFDTKKFERAGSADMKRFGVILGSTQGNGVVDKLKQIFQG